MPSSQHDAVKEESAACTSMLVCACAFSLITTKDRTPHLASLSHGVLQIDKHPKRQTEGVCMWERGRESDRVMRGEDGFPNINKSSMCFVTLAEFTSGRWIEERRRRWWRRMKQIVKRGELLAGVNKSQVGILMYALWLKW